MHSGPIVLILRKEKSKPINDENEQACDVQSDLCSALATVLLLTAVVVSVRLQTADRRKDTATDALPGFKGHLWLATREPTNR